MYLAPFTDHDSDKYPQSLPTFPSTLLDFGTTMKIKICKIKLFLYIPVWIAPIRSGPVPSRLNKNLERGSTYILRVYLCNIHSSILRLFLLRTNILIHISTNVAAEQRMRSVLTIQFKLRKQYPSVT